MIEKVITDNVSEKMTVRWDGERFAIVTQYSYEGVGSLHVTILNPKEMLNLVLFAGGMGESSC